MSRIQDGLERLPIANDKNSHGSSILMTMHPCRTAQDVMYTTALRFFDKSLGVRSVSNLDLSPENVSNIQYGYMNPQGMFLVTSPTGSGKSITLYSVVNALNVDSNRIFIVENLVEQVIRKRQI